MSIVSLSANTAYWQTRYENNHRTLVCYKTIQGSSDGNPGATPNDPASIGPDGEPRPQYATTTRRDPGAPAGDPNAPPGGRIGPNEPENSLFGVMYVGDNDSERFHLTIPAGNANGEFASNPAWRNAGISTTSATTLPEANRRLGVGPGPHPARLPGAGAGRREEAHADERRQTPKTPGCRTPGAHAPRRRPQASRATSARSSTAPRAARSCSRPARWSGPTTSTWNAPSTS